MDIEFRGTDRFRPVRRLGAGGMGVVYEAHDTLRRETVALKTILFLDADAIYRLKKEFRALAGVVHPHLVALYELVGEHDEWFFTMELLDGEEFLDHVRPGGRLDEARLRRVLPLITDGLMAVHAAGKLHRDLKPSNVMVSRDGRPVILDFGIATDIVASAAKATVEEGIWGTPLYMSPEQANGAAEPASDWYAVGVMLYEALTGQAPFDGNFFTMLSAKMMEDPKPPQELVPGLPDDLAQLCTRLLARDPASRATGEDILATLGAAAVTRRATPATSTGLVGREEHLAVLRESLATTRAGTPATVLVHGRSGSGKTTLVDAFLAEVAQDPAAVVLAGRCYVRESVPYKGLDGVLDSLSRWLLALPAERLDAFRGPGLAAAARLFPALGRIPGLATKSNEAVDPEQLRRRAIGALRALFAELALAGPLVLSIDDIQWGDADSVNLLEEIFAPPDPPEALLLIAYRGDEVVGHPFLESAARRAVAAGARELAIEPLSSRHSREMARAILRVDDDELDAVVREAGGSPFLIEMLARHAAQTRDDTGPRRIGVSAAEMIERRLAELPPGAEPLLTALAVAARPLDALVARDVAGLGDERPIADVLRAEHLLRPAAAAGRLELYHDRIREAVVGRIAPARLPGLHLKLAEALEARGGADPETLYEHFLEAGRTEPAFRYAVAAADVAARALAFERAADLYQRAIGLGTELGEDTRGLEARRGDALANAGHGLAAADVYLDVAARHAHVEAVELRRRAADQLLRCGHVERGLEVAETVLADVGLPPLPGSQIQSLLRLLVRRAAIRLRGLRFRQRPADEIAPEVLRRLDVCWTVWLGMVRVDNLRAADYQCHHLLLSLRAGEPYRISRALACETSFSSLEGGATRKRSFALLERTYALARETGHPHAIGIAHLADAIARHFVGEFAESSRAADVAERILRSQCTGVWWEIDSAQEYGMASDYYRGAWDEVARRAPARLREGQSHGDRYAVADVAAGRPNIAWLMRDDAAEARRVANECIAPWSSEAFHVPQWLSLYALCQVDFYENDGARAWERFAERWHVLSRSMLLRIQLPRIEIHTLRARCAVAAAQAGGPDAAKLRAIARQHAAQVRRERMSWALPLALLVEAALRQQEGADAEARSTLTAAVSAADAAGLAAHAAAARRRLGTFTGGEAGAALVRDADAWFRTVGGVRGDRLTAVLAPGFAD